MTSPAEPTAPRHYTVVGLPNQAAWEPSAEVRELLATHTIFSGGRRHYELIKALLPAAHTWLTIGGDMPTLFAQYWAAPSPIMVFASGDPLFYGMVRTIQTHDAAASLAVYPAFNSVQRLCAKLSQPYERVHATSVHGRSWQELDAALLRQEPLIAVLTDATRHPAAIAQRLLDYHFAHYEIAVGEDLDGPHERVGCYPLAAAAQLEFHPLNCVLLRQTAVVRPTLGIEDARFAGLPGRPGMLTKKAIRLLSLAQLALDNKQVLWDIGFCTGSVAIEARRLFPHLHVVAFEKRPECEAIMATNTHRLSAPGIEVVMGDFFDLNLAARPAPDAVFIGGHGNRLVELLTRLNAILPAGATVVLNAVLATSHEEFMAQAQALGWQLLPPQLLQLDQHNPIWVLTANK